MVGRVCAWFPGVVAEADLNPYVVRRPMGGYWWWFPLVKDYRKCLTVAAERLMVVDKTR